MFTLRISFFVKYRTIHDCVVFLETQTSYCDPHMWENLTNGPNLPVMKIYCRVVT